VNRLMIGQAVGGALTPDGQIIGAFQRGGRTNLYLLTQAGTLIHPLTDSGPINVSPSACPDGGNFVFTSDRSGTPQIYTESLDGGEAHRVTYKGSYNTAPSFSPDCRYVAVQASATPDIVGGVEDLNIYIVDLDTGVVRRIGALPYNEESPRFFPVGNRLAYSSFSPTEGVNLHVYDFDVDAEVLLAQGEGALQIAISPDGSRIFDPRTMRMYDAVSGAVTLDLLAPIAAALPQAGFDFDTRFRDEPGTPNRGMYPLDASFSPDGLEVVLDWAVRRGPDFGNILVKLRLATRQMTVVSDLAPTNPEFTNHNNFSQLNPLWK